MQLKWMPLFLLAAVSAGAAQPTPASCARVALDDAAVATLVDAASAPDNTPERGAARDRLFHQVFPQVTAEGRAPSTDEAAGIADAARSVACASGPIRVTRAVVKGDLAYVVASGHQGGCSWLLRRDGDGWSPLMPIGWTVR